MIRNIVFDMGQVLIHFVPELFIEQLGVPEKDRQKLRDEVFRSVEWVRLDRGTISQEDAAASICGRLPEQLHGYVEELVCGWWKRPIIPVEGVSELVERLKGRGYGIYLLSNASTKLPLYFGQIPCAGCFDGKIVSADWKLLKPQHEIYEKLFEVYHLKPEECFFIDDAPINVEGAYCVGMAGTVFTGNVRRLEREMHEAGMAF